MVIEHGDQYPNLFIKVVLAVRCLYLEYGMNILKIIFIPRGLRDRETISACNIAEIAKLACASKAHTVFATRVHQIKSKFF